MFATVPLVVLAIKVAIWDSRRVFGSGWRSFEESTTNDVTTAEKSPAFRNSSLTRLIQVEPARTHEN